MGRNAEEDFPLNHKNSMLIHLTKAKKAHSKNSQFKKKVWKAQHKTEVDFGDKVFSSALCASIR